MDSFVKVLCVGCKVYYGSEARQGMCSVCFKDFKAKEIINKEQEQDTVSVSEVIPKENIDASEKAQPLLVKPVQNNPNSCWTCNKKVGYLGFKCKCEYIFCGSHRHFSDHNCDFDYKNYDRQKLNKKDIDMTNDSKMIK